MFSYVYELKISLSANCKRLIEDRDLHNIVIIIVVKIVIVIYA